MESNPLRFFRSLGRSREIAAVLLRHGFDDLVDTLHLRRYVQWGQRLLFRKRREAKPLETRARRIRSAFESLGATFIKFGQVVSTRPDLVPADVIEELSNLQENVPPFPTEIVVETVTNELGGPLDEHFAEFHPTPIAAGSLGQVHEARLHDGTRVAVKVRRPNVVRTVERDLSLMFELAILIERHVPEAEIFDPVGLVKQFARTIRRELNFAREARTQDEFVRLFRNDATLHVPRVYWKFTTEAVLTMEFIEGCRISDRQQIQSMGVSNRELAANGARIFMKQAFEFGYFHGDPHPGNIRVLPDGSLCLLDYGMVGIIDDEKREQLVDLFVAVVHRDVAAAVEVVQSLGQPIRPVDEPVLAIDVREFVESYYGVSLEQLNVGAMLTDFVSILSHHAIRCPGDLMLLVRAMVTLEGVGRELDPNFNLAEYLAPFVERLVRERYNPRRIAARMFAEARTFLRVAHDVPMQAADCLEKLSKGELKLQMEHGSLERLITELDRSSNRVVIGVVMSSLIVASALFLRSGADTLWFSVSVLVLWSFLGVWLIYGVIRSGRL